MQDVALAGQSATAVSILEQGAVMAASVQVAVHQHSMDVGWLLVPAAQQEF